MSETSHSISRESLLAELGFVRGLARRLVHDSGLAEDVVQETCVAAIEAPPGSIRAHRSWLGGVVRRLSARTYRAKAATRRRETAAARPDGVPSVAEVAEREEARHRVVRAVLRLREPYRSVVILRYLEERPPREIAKRLDVPIETVRTRLKRAIGMLRSELDREHEGDRRAWARALVPFALSPTQTGGASAAAGALTMSAKTLTTVGLAALFLLLAGVFLWPDGDAPAAPLDAPPAVEPTPPAPVEDALDVAAKEKDEAAPTGTIVIRATDLSTGRRLARFALTLKCRTMKFEQRPGADLVEAIVQLPEPEGEDTVVVNLVEPPDRVLATRRVLLRTGDRLEVDLTFRSGPEIQGVVRDREGNGVVRAWVFLGNQIRVRGDEPFKPFRMDRARDAVRTGEDGRFVLTGEGVEITAFHEKLSPVTVPIDEAGEIVLPPRGTIRGRIVDAAGHGVPGVEVALDRARKVTTDADGRFVYEDVIAGVRGLALPDRRFAGVRLQAGETVDAVIGPGIETVRVAVRKEDGSPGFTKEDRYVVLLGTGSPFTVHPGKPLPGEVEFTAEGVLPGQYLFLSGTGRVALLDIDGPEATVALGTGRLEVTGPPKTRVYVVPEEVAADELVQLMGGRMTFKYIPESGPCVFTDLAPGRYAVGIERVGIRATVEVGDEPATVSVGER